MRKTNPRAEDGFLPSIMAKKNKYDSPYVVMILQTLVLITISGVGVASSNQFVILLLSASCFWLVAYVIAHLNVLTLKRKYPDAKRNRLLSYKGIPQIIGIIGSIFMIINISDNPAQKQEVYRIFLVVLSILVVYAALWVKLKMKRPLFGAEEIVFDDDDAEAADNEIKAKLA